MSTANDATANPTAEENDAVERNSAFQSDTSTRPLSTNPNAPHQQTQQPQPEAEASNSAAPEALGGLVDPQQAAFEDGT